MAEKLTEIELSGIVLDDTKPRSLNKDPSFNVLHEDDIDTALGILHVAVQGDRSKPAILTYHDIGLNHITCFQGFFNYLDMQPILKHFCVYHLNAPGQQEGASALAHRKNFQHPPIHQLTGLSRAGCVSAVNSIAHKRTLLRIAKSSRLRRNDATRKDEQENLLEDASRRGRTGYPLMDQLAEMLLPVLQFYQIKRFIGFGVGAGANILTRFAIIHPDKVDALFLVESTSTQAGWAEWFYQNINTWYLKGGNMTNFTEEYLLWHWFGKDTKDRNHDLVTVFKQNMKTINTHNLAMFIDSYMHRTDLGLIRNLDPTKKGQTKSLKCNVMLITGAFSPHLDDVVNMNGRLDPVNATWMKVSDCGGMPLEEQPASVCEAFRLFLQGMGYVPTLSQTKIVNDREIARRSSMLLDSQATVASNKRASVC